MAANTNNRIPVKWVRDRAKAAYDKKDCCYICDTKEELELHHLTSITILLNTWADKMSYDISTDEGIIAVRDEFIESHHDELYNQVYTLCNTHHVKLHGVYGKAPLPLTAPKQKRWIEIQRSKNTKTNAPKPVHSAISGFSAFY